MSKLPKAVQDLAEQADRMTEQMLGDQAAESDPQEPSARTAEVSQPPAEPSVSSVDESSKSDQETWQKRYLTLQGMFNAEVPRLNSQVKELSSQLEAALASIESVKAAKPQTEPPTKLVTEKDVEAFGGELIDLVRRQAEDVFVSERAQLKAEIASLRSDNAILQKQLGGVAEKQGANDRRSYFGELKRLVPDYEQVNVDNGFIAWLAEVDPMSGVARQAYLNNAYEQFDVTRTATLFNTWKQATGRGAAQTGRQPQQELQRQVQPGSSKASVQPASSANERTWTQRDIEAFYTAVAKGQYSGMRDEAARIESEIDAAVAAGRVRT
jgi:hypothetical protein